MQHQEKTSLLRAKSVYVIDWAAIKQLPLKKGAKLHIGSQNV